MIRHEDDGYWIEHEQAVTSHHEDVFACLTTAEGLARWFPVRSRIDLRPGGLIELSWNREFTRTTTITILDFDPAGRIVWDWQVARSDAHSPLYWRVSPSVEEGCRVHLRQGPFGTDSESLIGMAEEAQMWTWHLCNLRSVLESKHDMRAVRPL